MKCPCEVEMKHQFTAQKDDHVILVYKCPKCGHEGTEVGFKYTPANCPGHQFQFEKWGFRDNQWKHEIYQIHLCDRCGERVERRYDSGEVGLREAVEPEDPRVLKYLELNKKTARFHMDEDDRKNFWTE